jgi:hypothetical protein
MRVGGFVSRTEKEGLLDFFLKARRALVEQWSRELPISELRALATENLEQRKLQPSRYLSDVFASKKCTPIPEFVFDCDFQVPLKRAPRKATALPENGACALFLPPEQGLFSLEEESSRTWKEFLNGLSSTQICLRTGFLSTEFDVLETVALGFQGLCVHARVLDVYEIQLLTEICRDYRITLVAIADSQEALARVLESDCPYAGLWGYDSKSFAPSFSLVSKLSSKVPSTCYRMAFLPSEPEPQWDVLHGMQVASCVF